MAAELHSLALTVAPRGAFLPACRLARKVPAARRRPSRSITRA